MAGVNVDPRDLQQPHLAARFVCDPRTGEIVGIALRNPRSWQWEFMRLEGEVEREFRATAISMFVDEFFRVVGVVPGPETRVDEVVSVVRAVLEPQTILLRLCNAVAQAIACHLQLAPLAPWFGKLAENALAYLLPDDGEGWPSKTLRGLAVVYDISGNQFTPTVRDYTADALADVLQSKTAGITSTELNDRVSLVVGPSDLIDDYEPGGLYIDPGYLPELTRHSPVEEPQRGPGNIGRL